MLSAEPVLHRKSLQAGGGDQRSTPVQRWSSDVTHYLVELDHMPAPEDLDRLRGLGAQPVSLVPDSGLIVAAPDGTTAGALGVVRLRSLAPEEKISPLLRSPKLPSGAAAGWFVVEFHPDVNPYVAEAIAVQAGWLIRNNPDLAPGQVLVQGSADGLKTLAAWDEVDYIFPASRRLVRGEPVYVCAGADSQAGTLGQSIPLVGDGWDGPGLGSANLSYAFYNVTRQLPSGEVAAIIVRAFNEWAKYVQVNFTASNNSLGNETIGIRFATGAHGDPYPFGPAGGILAHTFYPAPVNPEPIAGDMHFNDANTWGIGTNIDLFSVALHETGHALGLGHSDLPTAVMYPYYQMATGLSAEDVGAVQKLYAARSTPPGSGTPPSTGTPSTPTTPTSPTTPTTPTTPTPTSGNGSGGNNGGSGKGSKDTTPPSLSVTSPASTSVTTSAANITVKGSANDASGVASVVWSTAAGASGTASGTSAWTAGPIPLYRGMNTITVKATDAAGNTSWRTVMVRRN